MSTSLTAIELKQALGHAGCPICRIQRETARHYIDSLLWESVNDLETRRHFLAGGGYCSEHTRILAHIEMEKFGDVVGVSIMYAHLASLAKVALETTPPSRSRRPRKSSRKITQAVTRHLLTQAECRICQTAAKSAGYSLRTLLEELVNASGDWKPLYAASAGLCLAHLEESFQSGSQFQEALEFLRQDALARVASWEAGLEGYVRKHSWDHREEVITETERQAWRQALTFFTSLSPEDLPRDKDSHNDG